MVEYPPYGSVTTLYELIQRAVSLTENADFIGEQDTNAVYQWIKYADVIKAAEIVGSALLKLGINAGETSRVGLSGLTSARYIIAHYAMISYSMVAVPLYHNYKLDLLCSMFTPTFSQIIEDCNLEVIFFDKASRAKEFISRINDGYITAVKKIIIMEKTENAKGNIEIPEKIQAYNWDEIIAIGQANLKPVVPPSPMSVFLICHTSGTTGTPKGVQLSHRALLASMAGLYTQWCIPPHNLQFGLNDVYLSFLSMGHVYEHLMQAFIIYIGGRIGIFGGDVRNLTNDMRILKPTIIAMVPRLLNRFYENIHAGVREQSFLKRFLFQTAVKAKLKLLAKGNIVFNTVWDKIVFKKIQKFFGGNLKMIATGGAPISSTVMNFSRIAYGCLVFEGYGQTECSAAGTITLPFDTTAGHVGGPAAWAQIKLVDVDDMDYKAADDVGEVCFKGAALMSGYFNAPKLTADTVDDQGWLHTGDIGKWLPNGSLKIIDRKNNLFKLAQSDFISPEQIENVYVQHPLVKQILVYGTPLKSYLVAITVVDEKLLREDYASKTRDQQAKSMNTLPTSTFLSNHAVRLHFIRELRNFGAEKSLTKIEQIKNVHLIKDEFTPESGLATPTLKMKRALLHKQFAEVLDSLYNEEPLSE
ncbi:unnamed protein product [Enterobius vermicularis]|uniref:long-chain-fatty-acid--CoA ligase n=1 Tax=Enterobius vermicularis TaxID=51028 RepID=A0A3P6INJ2_ENTVE|nr:unnamed protein product [Enterobius vermicularis]